MHWVTVARWRRNGWQTGKDDDHPLDVARRKLESILPVVTGDPVPAKDKVDGSAEELSDAGLLRRESKKTG
jgi:hypothetical protein